MAKQYRKVLTVILAVVFVISATLLVRHKLDTARAEQGYANAQQLAGLENLEDNPTPAAAPTIPATEPTAPEETLPAVTEPQTKWVPVIPEEDPYLEQLAKTDLVALREVNPDVIGWIFLPKTQINYPIVQGEDNQFYLAHTWEGKKSAAGSIFLESTNSADLTDRRSILYGHNMMDMSMFAALNYYKNAWHWDSNRYVYLVTDEGAFRYEIYSYHRADISSNIYALGLDDPQEIAGLIQLTMEAAEYDTGIVPASTDRILTLSTCVGSDTHRQVVHARLEMVEVPAEE